VPVEGTTKKGRKRERGEEGKREKKWKKKEGRKEENKSFNGSTHSLTKFTAVLDPPVALHKDINCSCLESICPKQSMQALALLSQPTSKLLKFQPEARNNPGRTTSRTEKSCHVSTLSCLRNVSLRQKRNLFCHSTVF
jgi:hypothetical protein